MELLHLRHAYGSLDVCQSIVVPDFCVYVLYRIIFRLRGQVFRFLRPLIVVTDDHSPTAGCDQLVAVEAKARDVAQVSDFDAFVLRAETLGGVFDNRQFVLPREFKNRIQVHRVSENVNRNDGPNTTAGVAIIKSAISPLKLKLEKVLDLLWIHLPIPGLSVDEYGPGAHIPDRICRCYKA